MTEPRAMPARDRREASAPLAEVLGALSLATDLANAHPMQTALRTGVLAASLARELGRPRREQGHALYAGVLRYVGCTSYAHEESQLAGDDIAVRRLFTPVDLSRRGEVVAAAIAGLGRGRGASARIGTVARSLGRAGTHLSRMMASHCEAGRLLGSKLGIGAPIETALDQIFERWDGRGGPRGLRGDDIDPCARIVHAAAIAALYAGIDGPEAARAVIERRRGGQLDPAIADALLSRAPEILDRAADPSAWERFASEAKTLAPPESLSLDRIAEAFADAADLKSTYTLGHARGVAALATRAGHDFGLSKTEQRDLRLAAFVHDIGRVSVPTGIWDKPGPLTAAEWERVRLHAYWTERILSPAPALGDIADIAADHHERLGGGGYPKRLPAPALAAPARILMAADTAAALREDRPHRPARSLDDARRTLEDEVRAGRLDAEATAAVAEAAGAPLAPPALPADLTEREVDVLRRLAVGHSNKEIAHSLSISARTVQHHVAHIYAKAGVETRVGAALFALEHDLLPHPGLAARRRSR